MGNGKVTFGIYIILRFKITGRETLALAGGINNNRHIINRIVGDAKNKGESYKDALIVVCTKINGQGFVIEDLDALWYDDLVKLQSMATDLNFM